jgi:hypothetical protein
MPVNTKRFPVQPPLRTDRLWPAQRTSPQVPQNLLRPTWKGPVGISGSNVHGIGCGCDNCSAPYMSVDQTSSAYPPVAKPSTLTFSQAFYGIGRHQLGALGMLGVGTEESDANKLPEWLTITLGGLSLLAGAAAAYHGTKRYESVWAGVGWYFLGAIAWPIVIPVAFAQGYGQRK